MAEQALPTRLRNLLLGSPQGHGGRAEGQRADTASLEHEHAEKHGAGSDVPRLEQERGQEAEGPQWRQCSGAPCRAQI